MNSVEMRVPGGISRALFATCSFGTASTTRVPWPVPLFAYDSVASTSTSASVSAIQSCPVIPTSNSPSCTYVGISCGRSSDTRSIRSSSIDPW